MTEPRNPDALPHLKLLNARANLVDATDDFMSGDDR
jgi:hypothetical protein